MGGGSWAWPDVDTLEGAEDAAHKAAYFAWIVAGLTVLSILLFMSSEATLPAIAIIITLFLAVAYALIGWQVYESRRVSRYLGSCFMRWTWWRG